MTDDPLSVQLPGQWFLDVHALLVRAVHARRQEVGRDRTGDPLYTAADQWRLVEDVEQAVRQVADVVMEGRQKLAAGPCPDPDCPSCKPLRQVN